MSQSLRNPPQAISAQDRLIFALFLVCTLHALAIFGIRFVAEDPAQISPPPSVEIILSQTSNETLPDEADFLGRSDSAGGDAEIKERVRRSDVFAAFTPEQDLGAAPTSREQLNAPTPAGQAPDVLTAPASAISVRSQREAELDKQPVDINSITDQEALQVASLTQELRMRREQLSRQQKVLTLNANTREYVAAEYVSDWVRSVESIGNTNLPPALRSMSGDVILEVKVNSQGQLQSTRVLRSSGHVPLDEAAQQSVRLASPFKSFPPQLREKADILNIVRTWRYAESRLVTLPSPR